MVKSIREAEARKGWLFATRIKALKGESQGGFGLKHDHSNVTLAIAKGAKRVRNPAGAGGWSLVTLVSLRKRCKNRVLK